MKIVFIILLSIMFCSAKAQFPGTDSLRNYNNKYITNNPATAFTNLRLNTLLRGIIDWVDTARAGTGGGGALGIDTMWALNDSTVRYRKNGVFRNMILKGVYDTRRKVDTMYKVNDTTIGFKINGTARTIIIPGRAAANHANAALTANADYTQNWAQHILKYDSTKYVEFNSYRPDPLLVAGNVFTSKLYLDSTVNGRPFSLSWALRNGANNGDSIRGILETNESTTSILNSGDNGNQFGNWQFIGNSNNPRLTGTLVAGVESSSYSFGRVATINPNDSTRVKAIAATTAPKMAGLRAVSSDVYTVVAMDIPAGGSATLSNIGSGYRWVKTTDGQIKTVENTSTVKWDSATNSLSARVDTAEIATQYDLTQIVSGINQLTGDVIAGPGTGPQTATIANNAVTNGKLAQAAALTVKGNPTNATANAQDIPAGTDNQVLRRSGSTVGFGAVNLASSDAVTGLLPVVNTATPRTYPAEQRWGTIYEKNTWSDLSDFTPTGTSGAALNTGAVNITANTNDYTPVVRILRSRPTGLSKWKMTMRYKVTAWSGTSYWFGPIMKGLLNHGGASFGVCGFSDATNSGGSNSYVITESGTILTSGGGPSKSLNDVMEVTLSRNDTAISYTIRNVTTSSATTTLNYSYPANHSEILPNVGTWGMMYNSTGTGNIRVEYIKIESDEKIAPNILCLGDSKTAIGFSDAYAGRWPALLQSTYPNVVYNAGSAEYVTDALMKIRELGQYNPQKVVIGFVGENDIRDGIPFATATANMKRLNDLFAAGGTEVYWIGLPEDSTGAGADGLSALNQWVKGNYPNNYINTWDSLSTNNVLKSIYNSGDDVHYNQAAMTKIAQTIVASGKLSTVYTNIRTPFRATDGIVGIDGDSIWLNIPIRPKANYVAKFSENNEVIQSNIYDDNTNVIVSDDLSHTPPMSNMMLSVKGALATYGNLSSIFMFDRSSPSQYFSIVKNGYTDLYNSADKIATISDDWGKWTFGNDSRVSAVGSVRILKGYSYPSQQGYKGLALNIDSAKLIATTGTNFGDGSIVSIGRYIIDGTSPGTVYNSMASLLIEGEPYAGSNMTYTKPYALNILRGSVRMAGLDSSATATGGFMFKDALTGDVRITAGASGGVTSINSQTGTSQTISGGAGINVGSSSDVHTVSLNTTLDVQVSDANNTGTSATDLYSKTIAANQLTLNGQSIHFEAAGVNNDATATVNLEALFAGNGIAGTGAVTISGTGAWIIRGTIIRATSTTARVYTTVSIDNTTQKIFSTTGNLTGLDWTATNILKIQATAGGAGGGSNDITAQMWKVVFQP